MTWAQIDIPKDLRSKLQILKYENDFETLPPAILFVLNDYFKLIKSKEGDRETT